METPKTPDFHSIPFQAPRHMERWNEIPSIIPVSIAPWTFHGMME
jgi:hypothetical protein